jgi:hypothetical protein
VHAPSSLFLFFFLLFGMRHQHKKSLSADGLAAGVGHKMPTDFSGRAVDSGSITVFLNSIFTYRISLAESAEPSIHRRVGDRRENYDTQTQRTI